MEWLIGVVDDLRQLLPQLIAALALLIGGWLLAHLLKSLANRLVTGILERFRRNVSLERAVEEAGVRSAIPRIVAAFVFWVVFLLFAAAAIESLGFTVVTSVLSQVTYYLPNVLAAAIVLAGGMVLGKLVRKGVGATARSSGIIRADRVGQTTQGAVVLVAAVVALDQIGIDAQLLVTLVTVMVGAAFASAGLAFGIGAKTTVSNIVAAYYLSQTYRTGQTVRIGEIQGELLQLTPTAVILGTAEGRMLIPAKRFSEEASLLLLEAS
jgi:small-conductance mechanosensitive channel